MFNGDLGNIKESAVNIKKEFNLKEGIMAEEKKKDSGRRK